MPRRTTLSARLARMGFADPAQAERLAGGDLALDIDSGDAGLLAALAAAADPDLALAALARMPRDAELLTALHQDADLARRLALVLGASAALGDHLARHPEGWRLLRGPEPLACPSAGELRSALLTAVGADPGAPEPVAAAGQQAGPDAGPAAALRVAYRQRLLHLAARDLTGQMAIDDVAAELADLAAAALEAALAIARSQLPAGAAPCRLAVIAMGKCGGRELNYASDVDVIFVAEPAEGAPGDGNGAALHTATQLAAGMIRVCSQSTAGGHPLPGRPEPASRGPRRPAGPDAGQPPGVLRALGEDVGVPGAAQGPAGGRRSRARRRLRAGVHAAGLAGGPARQLRRRHPRHAPPGDQHPARGRGRPPAQARSRRAARHRVRGAAAAAGARPQRRHGPQPGHAARAGGARRRRLRGPGRRRQPGRRLPVPALGGAPAPAAPAAPHPHPARRPGRAAQARPGAADRRGGRGRRRPRPRALAVAGRPGRRAHRRLAPARRRGPAAAREALLPPAAGGGGAAARARRPG